MRIMPRLLLPSVLRLALCGCSLFRDRPDPSLESEQAQNASPVGVPLAPSFDPVVHDDTISTPSSLFYVSAVAHDGASVDDVPSSGSGSTLSTGATSDVTTMTITVTRT